MTVVIDFVLTAVARVAPADPADVTAAVLRMRAANRRHAWDNSTEVCERLLAGLKNTPAAHAGAPRARARRA